MTFGIYNVQVLIKVVLLRHDLPVPLFRDVAGEGERLLFFWWPYLVWPRSDRNLLERTVTVWRWRVANARLLGPGAMGAFWTLLIAFDSS